MLNHGYKDEVSIRSKAPFKSRRYKSDSDDPYSDVSTESITQYSTSKLDNLKSNPYNQTRMSDAKTTSSPIFQLQAALRKNKNIETPISRLVESGQACQKFNKNFLVKFRDMGTFLRESVC
jgi:hypothetical protein